MKENVFFRVWYSTYLKKEKERQESWTSRLMKKINEHKFITMIVAIIIACTMTNFFLIYRFIHIIEKIWFL